MTEGGVASNTDNVLEAGYRQSHHPIKDNVENKQVDETEEFPEARNRNNPAIRLHRGQCPHGAHLYRKSNTLDKKVLPEPQYRPI